MSNKKAQILKATETILATSGFHGLSIQKVANEAKVATGTIYRYFKDRDDLLNQLHEQILTYVAHRLEENVDESQPLKEQFTRMWKNLWYLPRQEDAPLLTRNQFESLPISHHDQLRQKKDVLFSTVHRFFNEGKQQGVFKPLPNPVLWAIGLEPSIGLTTKHLSDGLDVNDAILEDIINACWDAIILS